METCDGKYTTLLINSACLSSGICSQRWRNSSVDMRSPLWSSGGPTTGNIPNIPSLVYHAVLQNQLAKFRLNFYTDTTETIHAKPWAKPKTCTNTVTPGCKDHENQQDSASCCSTTGKWRSMCFLISDEQPCVRRVPIW